MSLLRQYQTGKLFCEHGHFLHFFSSKWCKRHPAPLILLGLTNTFLLFRPNLQYTDCEETTKRRRHRTLAHEFSFYSCYFYCYCYSNLLPPINVYNEKFKILYRKETYQYKKLSDPNPKAMRGGGNSGQPYLNA